MNIFIAYAWPISVVVSSAIFYYIGHRSPTGVKSDLQDIKNDIATIKTKVKSTKAVVKTDVQKETA